MSLEQPVNLKFCSMYIKKTIFDLHTLLTALYISSPKRNDTPFNTTTYYNFSLNCLFFKDSIQYNNFRVLYIPLSPVSKIHRYNLKSLSHVSKISVKNSNLIIFQGTYLYISLLNIIF